MVALLWQGSLWTCQRLTMGTLTLDEDLKREWRRLTQEELEACLKGVFNILDNPEGRNILPFRVLIASFVKSVIIDSKKKRRGFYGAIQESFTDKYLPTMKQM